MKRENFKKIIKLRSMWKIDKRKGNYKLPSGKYLSDYITHLVESQMKIDNLGIRKDGDLCFVSGGEWNKEAEKFDDYTLMSLYKDNEICSYDEMKKRIKNLIHELLF